MAKRTCPSGSLSSSRIDLDKTWVGMPDVSLLLGRGGCHPPVNQQEVQRTPLKTETTLYIHIASGLPLQGDIVVSGSHRIREQRKRGWRISKDAHEALVVKMEVGERGTSKKHEGINLF